MKHRSCLSPQNYLDECLAMQNALPTATFSNGNFLLFFPYTAFLSFCVCVGIVTHDVGNANALFYVFTSNLGIS